MAVKQAFIAEVFLPHGFMLARVQFVPVCDPACGGKAGCTSQILTCLRHAQ